MKKKVIGLIDGQSGNIGSINKAIEDIIKGKPYRLKIIKGHFNYSSFDKIILPGQGAYATLMSNLNHVYGFFQDEIALRKYCLSLQ